MNPRVAHIAFVIAGIGGAAFVAFMIFCVLFAGCSTALPPEPPFVEIITGDAARFDQ